MRRILERVPAVLECDLREQATSPVIQHVSTWNNNYTWNDIDWIPEQALVLVYKDLLDLCFFVDHAIESDHQIKRNLFLLTSHSYLDEICLSFDEHTRNLATHINNHTCKEAHKVFRSHAKIIRK